MATLKETATITDYQNFIREVYGVPNDKHFSVGDMHTNVERFLMRGLKGIRKKDPEKIKSNLMIATSWCLSLLNRFHIPLEEEVWQRFPYLCSYCGSCPCTCKAQKISTRQAVRVDESKRPHTIRDFQEMFKQIYPPAGRTLEHAGIHLAEELGEFSEAILIYQSSRNEKDFANIRLEVADFFSCLMGVFNSADIDVARELSAYFSENCHKCKQAPCACTFTDVLSFKS